MRRTACFLAALLILAPAAPAPAAPPGVTLTSGDAGRIAFRVDFPAPTWREDTVEGRDYRWLDWAGYPGDAEPGSPAVPVRILEVAVPPTGEVRVSHTEVRAGAASGVRFPPRAGWRVPEPTREEPRPQVSGLLLAEGVDYAQAGPLPQVESLGVQTERGLRILRVAVRPVRWDPATGRAEWSSRVDVAVSVSGAAAAPAPRPRSDAAGRAAWSTRLVNPEAAGAWTAPRAQQEAGIPERWFDDASGWLKIRLGAEGVYRLDRAALQSAGVPVASLDPRTFRMYCGPLVGDAGFDTARVGAPVISPRWRHVYDKTGFTAGFDAPVNPVDGRTGMNQVAVWVRGEEDGAFDSGDDVVFYGQGPDGWADRYGLASDEYAFHPYTTESVYWLSWGGSAADLGPPARMAVDDAAPGADEPLREGLARVHAEDNTWYDPSMYVAGLRWEEWFWRRLTDGRPETFRVALPGIVAGSAVDGRVRLWGGNQPIGDLDCYEHIVRVDVNGTLVETARWGALGGYYRNYDVALDAVPGQGAMDVRIEPLTCGTNPNRFDLVYLAWIEMHYRRSLNAGGAALEFTLPEDSAGRTVAVSGAPASPLLLDVTDFRNPRRVTGAAADGELRFRAGTGGGVYRVLPAGGIAAPPAIALDSRPARLLRDTGEPVDYVIITADAFEAAAEELAQWRRDHLIGITGDRPARVRVVRISDVYDEFSGGVKDPAAIRYFLEYAYRYYGGPADDPLSYAVFLGDHTYDVRDHLRTGVPDFVPSWEDNRESIGLIRYGNVQYVADDPLVTFDGAADQVADVYIGRIPVSTGQEAAAIIRDKIIRSEREPDRGPWRMKAILVADDICQGQGTDTIGFLHMAQTEGIDEAIPAYFDRDKVYLYEYGEECVVDSKPEAKSALLASWTEGAWFVNYIGHGADIVLADEHVFDSVDIPLLDNAGRLPVVGTFSCSVGKFSKPLGQGLGEAWVRALNGGAVASYSATNITFSGPNAVLNGMVMEEMFPDPDRPWEPATVGAALMNAKRRQLGESIKYVCMGDPASRPGVPEHPLQLTGPGSLVRGQLVTVASAHPGGLGGTGLVDLDVRDAREYRTEDSKGNPFPSFPLPGYYRAGSSLFRGRAAFGAEGTAQQFVVPMSLRTGADGRIRAYAWGDDAGANGVQGWDGAASLTPLAVEGSVFVPDDQAGPAISYLNAGEPLVAGTAVRIGLEDPAGIDITQLFDFRGILLRIRDADDVEQLRLDLTGRFDYELGSFTKGSVSAPVPDLPPGTYRLVVSAYDNYTNKAEASFEVSILDAGGEASFQRVFAYPNPMRESTRLAFSLDRPAQVEVRVFSVAGRLVWEADVPADAGENALTWDGRDGRGDAVANGVYLVQLTAKKEDGSGDVKHLERLVVYR